MRVKSASTKTTSKITKRGKFKARKVGSKEKTAMMKEKEILIESVKRKNIVVMQKSPLLTVISVLSLFSAE